MKEFLKPQIEIVELDSVDVIVTSDLERNDMEAEEDIFG